MKLRLVETRDGSHSLVNDLLGESYHHLKGALTESQYVFIDKGFAGFEGSAQPVRILEIGLGTGLNILLTTLQAPGFGFKKVHMTSLEPFPLPQAITQVLNFPTCLPEYPQAARVLEAIHKSPPSVCTQLTPLCDLTVHHLGLEAFVTTAGTFDLVYFDAFAPAVQSDVWAKAQLARVFSWMRPGGRLVTYCANAQFKRDLKAIGFQVEALPGYLGKREMTRAQVPANPRESTR